MSKHNNFGTNRQKLIITAVFAAILILIASAATFALFRTGGILNNQVQQTEVPSQTTNPKEHITETPPSDASDARYLMLEDWGVKFEVPENIGDVRYYRQNSNVYPEFEAVDNKWYEFSTRGVEDLGGKGDNICVEPNDRNVSASRLGGIIRSSKILPVETKPLNENAIEGYYYYYYGSAHSICSSNSTDLQENDLRAIRTMIESISPSR